MKNKIIALMLAMSLGTIVLAPRAHALGVGIATANPGLVIGGAVATTFGVLGSIESVGNVRAGAVSVIFLITGIILDQDFQTIKESALKFDIKSDLEQKVIDGIYLQPEADTILADYRNYVEKHVAEANRITFNDAAKRSGQDLVKQLMQESGLQEITAQYLVTTLLGIQTIK